MSGRFPGSASTHEFWANLCAGRSGIAALSAEELLANGVSAEALADANYVKVAPLLADHDCFDAEFFWIPPRDAEVMDPQHRLLLECAWSAMEDAGYPPGTQPGRVGVFAGSGGIVSSQLLSCTGHYADVVGKTGGHWHVGNDKDFVPTRLSYKLNLRGPSVAVQTACSTSLVAVHMACQSIRSGECDMALAGAVSVRTPHVAGYLYESGNILSADGQVRAFDADARGVVFGSGVGMVLLKPLEQALADGDCIHAVIKGSAINNDGGQKMSFLATKVEGQLDCMRSALDNAGVSADSLGYIEAHGTGTAMGDPIEILALSRLFRSETERRQFCAIGSVKNNIGHLDIAAGMASLIKVAMSLKFQHIPPCINFAKPNPKIDFENSPFHVNTDSIQWPQADTPRRAAINCLGIGGTNVFMVLEEPPPRPAPPRAAEMPRIVVLSAKTEAALWRKVADLAAWLEAGTGEHLDDIAFTLATGRSAFANRCVLVASDASDLLAKLGRLNRHRRAPDCFVGLDVEQSGNATPGLDEFAQFLVQQVLGGLPTEETRSKLLAMADLYCRGAKLSFDALYAGSGARRVALPTYPFEKRRFAIPQRPEHARPEAIAAAAPSILHPLLHANVSDISGLIFTSKFDGEEFFLRDHVVLERRVLPGVAYVEMVRAAAMLALPGEQTRTLEFKDHAWIQPVVVDDAFALTVALHDNSEDESGGRWLEYEIFSEAGGETPHARGTVRCGAQAIDAEPLDIAAVGQTIEGENRDRDALYARFQALGLRYGPTMQGIAELRSDGDEVIARLRLPEASGPRFGLHPAMMDSAMQCTIGLLAGLDSESGAAVMPFAFDEMIVHGVTTDEMWVWVRRAPGASVAGMPSLDIDLIDDQGRSRVSIRGLVSRTVASAPSVASTRAVGTVLALARPAATPASRPALHALVPIWNPVRFGRDTVTPAPGERCLLLGGDEALFAWLRAAAIELQHQPIVAGDSVERIERLLSEREFDHLLWFAPEADVGDDDAIVPSQEAGVLSLFRILKALSRLDRFERELKFTVVTRRALQVFDGERVSPHHAGVHGMVGSVAKELPLWRLRLLDIESTGDLDPREILALPWDEQGRGLAFRFDEWFRQEFADVGRMPSSRSAYRQNGVYVVIGGAGGLGEVWTRHMVAHYDAQVIWVGRRPRDADIEAKLDAIEGLGRRPHYVSADATDAKALATAVAAIRERFPRIDGVVHSALVLRDQTVRAMDEAVFRQSLAAKVDVSVNIERAFAGQDLDFVLFFSSVASFHRDAGQSNYCAGCTFKDSFAQAMRARQPYPVKIVNWAYWGSVGVVTDAFYRKRMESLGIGSIEPDEAMRELEAFVASDLDQLALIKVISQRALDDLWVSEEVRYYQDRDASSAYGSEAVIAS
ncbi:SDR family NAD(P)-dependent oxidoreductase [Lysobacter sp. ISL-42]|nr:SDR family NAD(P)-dependent oxidoreductase [Lysobacter sp. ISL-42]MBT2752121.1 SDR family NAD(P)-dependent oxidoreductase [Lysobacter sp. ISL-50]MBT2778618.1 SDR family NAD(P)-dependent oxidoreductase [Lysobacter sp. ISL-54]MBT2780451.1 SDR family NAD(P)-dependent oxidoreductase [Lysobacter sp. ISL-52]